MRAGQKKASGMLATGFPFQDTLTAVLSAGIVGMVCGLFWAGTQSRGWLIAALVAGAAAAAFAACDRFVVTPREEIVQLLDSLARAAERQDLATILASIDPAVRPVREEAERSIRLVRPREVRLAAMEIECATDPAADEPTPAATARFIVRATADGTTETPERGQSLLLRLRLELARRGPDWLITAAEVER